MMNQLKKLRIIVFDDDPNIRSMLKIALSALGHQVLTYENPTICEVYSKSDSHCPQEFPCADIVITDNMMPKMSGVDYLSLMTERGCKIKTAQKALISAGLSEEQVKYVESLGCRYFRKPFKLSEITAWVKECAEDIPEDSELAQLQDT